MTMNARILAINFHYVRPRSGPLAKLHARTPEQFREQLDVLGEVASPLAPAELLEVIAGRRALPAGDHFVLTFDDGVKDQRLHVAPELKRRGWSAFMCVPTRPWEGAVLEVHKLHALMAMVPSGELWEAIAAHLVTKGRHDVLKAATVEQARVQYKYDEDRVAVLKFTVNFLLDPPTREVLLRELFARFVGDEVKFAREFYMGPDDTRALSDAGFEIGLHSHSHVPLALLSPAALRQDLALNGRLLADAIGKKPWAISYPYGSPAAVSPDVIAAAKEMGLKVGFTMRREHMTFPCDPLALARVDTNDAPGGKAPRFDLGRGAR